MQAVLLILFGHGVHVDLQSRVGQKGLRVRNSPTCTLSQNGYGEHMKYYSSFRLLTQYEGNTEQIIAVKSTNGGLRDEQ